MPTRPPCPVHLAKISISTILRYDPTIEDSYSVTRTIDGLPYFLSLTDTAGQEEYRGLWAASNLQSDAFLLVYDITNASSLDALDYFMDMIDIEEENRIEENNRAILRGVKGGTEIRAPPVKIVAGNKCDLKDSRVVSSRTGLEWARKRRCGFMETSAREMVNIEETFACKAAPPS
jgi:small GTP-binding protein